MCGGSANHEAGKPRQASLPEQDTQVPRVFANGIGVHYRLEGHGMVVIGRGIDEIEAGQKASFTRVFTEDEVKEFSDLTWDHNPYHCHPGFASRSRFKRPIVHGMLVASAFTHFGGDFFPGPAILALEADMKFLKPVYTGETITFTAEVTEVDRENNRITYVTTAKNEKGEVVCTVTCHGCPTCIETDEENNGA